MIWDRPFSIGLNLLKGPWTSRWEPDPEARIQELEWQMKCDRVNVERDYRRWQLEQPAHTKEGQG